MPTKLTAIESALPLLPSARAKALAASSRVELTRQNLAKHATVNLTIEPERWLRKIRARTSVRQTA